MENRLAPEDLIRVGELGGFPTDIAWPTKPE